LFLTLVIVNIESKLSIGLTITIVGNNDFGTCGCVTTGTGLEGNPYVIENMDITSLQISNTDAFVIIRNISIYSSNSLPFQLNNVSHAHISNISNPDVSKFSFNLITLRNVTDSKIDSNDFSNTGFGLFIINSSHLTITNNYFYNFTYGIRFFDENSFMNVSYNTFDTKYIADWADNFGMYFYKQSNPDSLISYLQNFTIEYNIFNNTLLSIYNMFSSLNSTNFKINNNLFFNTTYSIYIQSGKSFDIINNTFFNSYRGIEMHLNQSIINNNSYYIEPNNRFYLNGTGFVINGKNITSLNNLFYGGRRGYYINAENSIFNKNTISSAKIDGFFIYGKNNTFIGNIVSNSSYGFNLYFTTNNTYENNSILKNTEGIYSAMGKDSLFVRNDFQNNSIVGLHFKSDSTNNVIKENYFAENGLNTQDDGSNNWDNNTYGDYLSGNQYTIGGTANAIDTNPKIDLRDFDQDQMPNWFEKKYGLLLYTNDSNLDPDLDTLTNLQEFIRGSNPVLYDYTPPTTTTTIMTPVTTTTATTTTTLPTNSETSNTGQTDTNTLTTIKLDNSTKTVIPTDIETTSTNNTANGFTILLLGCPLALIFLNRKRNGK
jgi:parallel beta-helix repeat protein